MPDTFTPDQRHNCMSRIRSRDTKPEKKVRQVLFRAGFRYRNNVRTLPGTPDIVLPKYRTAIFVNGCFWHGHKGCPHYTVPETNTPFWVEKVRKNKERDALNNQRLESLSWSVLTIWECELSKSNLPDTMSRIESEIKANKAKWEAYTTRRKQDRQFALDQARKRREIAALVESELQSQFHIPVRIRTMTNEFD